KWIANGDNSLRQELANPAMGAGMVLSVLSDPAAVPTSVSAWLGKKVHAGANFGADVAVGAVAQTAKLKAFFNYCIANGVGGHIPKGDYTIIEGELTFDNGSANKPWPHITTDGYTLVNFNAAGVNNLPLLSITNGTAVSDVGLYWNGGSLGGITFNDSTGHIAANRHGI